MSNLDAMKPVGTKQGELHADASLVLNNAGQALFRLGRILSRPPLREQHIQQTGNMPELSQILVAEAVAVGPEELNQEVTVGVVAKRLAIDPSTASRLVAETIGAGYLSRTPSQTDSRRIRLELTDAGCTLVENAHHYQRTVFEYMTSNWPEQERQEFARLLVKFVESVAANRIS